jgi:calcium-translocating P-type ATPase
MKTLSSPHSLSIEEALDALDASPHGLRSPEAASRLAQFGRNTLPKPSPPGVPVIFLRQFLSPVIYVLLLAAVISFFLEEASEGIFISIVLLINALIGTVQEYSAERSAEALKSLVTTRAQVLRDDDALEIDAEELVPGDLILLEEGSKVPADIRLISDQSLEIDESLLTGESVPVIKNSSTVLGNESYLADRVNMAFAGSIVTRGRGRGIVVATGLATEIGSLAKTLLGKEENVPPLVSQMKHFTRKITVAVAATAVIVFAVELYRGLPIHEIFLESVALAVSAIPEGLPVTLTVALAIGMRRMAKRSVIIRRLVAVESLGSCSFIASDKTGTLTVNQMTVKRIILPGQIPWEVTGEGTVPKGEVVTPHGAPTESEKQLALLRRLSLASVLDNEGFLGRREDQWVHHGDAVDVALLVMAHKVGITRPEALGDYPEVSQIPFESERQFAATLNRSRQEGELWAFVKGAPERLLGMCSRMATPEGDLPLDIELIEKQSVTLANGGYRILAVASGRLDPRGDESITEEHLQGLTFLGLVGMIDPLRPEAKTAVHSCKKAGVKVAMVTGDHPITALAIARELGMAQDMGQVFTGSDLRRAEEDGLGAIDALISKGRVFARVEPRQKLLIVESLVRLGYTVAVTGDGANDAPALRAAHVGVAMGRGGTDIARESAELIITDDNFASIVAGIEEGRIVYSNVRKVIFLLISTGAAEVVLFLLALFANMPLPLLAVQLLWLNLVTNGIQDKALAFEPAEGDEMQHKPRPTKEPIFNRIMIERVLISAVVMGCLAFIVYYWLISRGWGLGEARNSTLLLMVFFENLQVFNSRSELRSAFRQNALKNPFLFFGTLAAQVVHTGAMYVPWLSSALEIQPVSFGHWLELLLIATTVLWSMEIYKLVQRTKSMKRL